MLDMKPTLTNQNCSLKPFLNSFIDMRTALLLFILFSWFQPSAQTISDQFQAEIDKARFLIQQHLQMINVPGVQVAVMVDGKLIWSEGLGFSKLEEKKKVTVETKFRIASISKSVTSMALGKLMESDLLDIDEDIRTYVPEFPAKPYPVTSRQLAASVSGIRHYNTSDPAYRTTHYASVIDALKVFKDDRLAFEPNTAYQYSSYGWVLLSAAMERAAGQSFFELMENSWKDLGMSHTSFDYPDKAIEDKSTFYVMGKKSQRVEAPEENRSYMYAGGGYLSTAEDLVKMGHQLISDQYISSETRKKITSSHVLMNGDSTYYGLGWETGVSRLNVPVIYHSGSLPSARSHLVIYPEQNVVFAYLSNTGDQIFFNDREAQSVAELFVNKVINDNELLASSEIEGIWEFETTSLRGKNTSGRLSIVDGQGTITYKRSKKRKTFPITVFGKGEEYFHLVAVSPMFIDFYLKLNDNRIEGIWLHDFNVKGIPEPDEYWRARGIEGKKID
jgi:CubicO group peptidase (beta-lactamase class C family)